MLLAFLLAILAVTKFTFCASTENDKSSGIQNTMPANSSSMPPILDATASKLVRYRSKPPPPPSFFRHKTQQPPPPKRSRPRVIKSPKIKNNRPVFQHFEQSLQPSSYYKFKPEIHTSTLAYKPSYTSYEEIHYEVSPDFPKKESNYETQAMDLDFYGGSTYSKKKSASQYEYSKPQKSYTKTQKVAPPQYEFTKPQKTFTIQQPQKTYGAPKEPSYNFNDYNLPSKPEVHYEISYHEESPEQDYHPPKQKYEEYSPYEGPPSKKFHQPEEVSYQIPESKYEGPSKKFHQPEQVSYQIPESKYEGPSKKFNQPEQVSYQIPDNKYEGPKKYHEPEQVSYQIPDNKYESPPASSYHPPELPSKEGPYQVYDKKLPNNGYKYNNDFAEPPTDIHIIHSPSYDIETLPPKHSPSQNEYENKHETYGPPPSDNYGLPHSVYGPPEYNKQSGGGNHHAPVDSYHQPNNGQFAEPPGSYLPPPHLPDDLPLNKNHMPPGYDYPKSSYEVPLYDPIPFESTTAEQDFFPPNHYDGAAQHEHVSEASSHIQHIPSTPISTTSTKQHKHDEQVQQANTKVHRFSPTNKRRYKKPNRYQTSTKAPISSEENFSPEAPSSEYLDEFISTTSTLRPRRKRKRTKAPPVAIKHNLDAPELQEAFETGRDQTDEELTANASDIKENIEPQEPQSKVQKITEFSPSNSWNPMRIRTKQPNNGQRGQRLAQTSLNDLKNVEVISIQKSHSHSYYAGTEAPVTKRTRTMTMTSRADAIKMPTVSTTTLKAENVLKPTRGGLVIDTTYFKVKGNDDDQEFYDGTGKLPKNHKMF